MATCSLCSAVSTLISEEIAVCVDCIRRNPESALPVAMKAHFKSRKAFGLPEMPPKSADGISCNICVNECIIPENGVGYCGLRKNEKGKIVGVSSDRGKLSWYHDPLPTNCVGDWVCPGGTGRGYPKYANTPGPERGYKNLAVFFHACTFNCLFCQNWHFRRETLKPHTTPVSELVSDVDERTACICYFGGDPAAQLLFSIQASRLALENSKGRILRICWETNGAMSGSLLDKMADIALDSGGCIKFDLKAWDKNLHTSLTGVTNERTLENFRRVGERIRERKSPHLIIASTLLVPGYIDEDEIRKIAKFIASVNPDIPYSLLAFHPHFYMSDMPLTTRSLAYGCLKIAHEEGLKDVRIGNLHLLA
ncbi:MAG TPA: radical SAM protein [Syntrophales bacterium]|nr:radical SAM protein [Syntrophales bacterium]